MIQYLGNSIESSKESKDNKKNNYNSCRKNKLNSSDDSFEKSINSQSNYSKIINRKKCVINRSNALRKKNNSLIKINLCKNNNKSFIDENSNSEDIDEFNNYESNKSLSSKISKTKNKSFIISKTYKKIKKKHNSFYENKYKIPKFSEISLKKYRHNLNYENPTSGLSAENKFLSFPNLYRFDGNYLNNDFSKIGASDFIHNKKDFEIPYKINFPIKFKNSNQASFHKSPSESKYSNVTQKTNKLFIDDKDCFDCNFKKLKSIVITEREKNFCIDESFRSEEDKFTKRFEKDDLLNKSNINYKSSKNLENFSIPNSINFNKSLRNKIVKNTSALNSDSERSIDSSINQNSQIIEFKSQSHNNLNNFSKKGLKQPPKIRYYSSFAREKILLLNPSRQYSKKVALAKHKRKNFYSKKFIKGSIYNKIDLETENEMLKEHEDETNKIYLSNNIQKYNRVYDSLSEDEENKIKRSFIFLPDSNFKLTYDTLMIIITFISVIYLPFKMILVTDVSLIMFIIDLIFDFVYLLNFFVSIFTAYHDFEENLIDDFNKIILHKLKFVFFLDLISSIPINLIYNIEFYSYTETYKNAILHNQFTSNIFSLDKNYIKQFIDKDNATIFGDLISFNRTNKNKFFFLLRMVYFLRILKDNEMIKKIKDYLFLEININSAFINISVFYIFFLFISHILTCIFIFLGTLDNMNWIKAIGLQNSAFYEIYFASLYFNHLTIFSIGYGDIVSKNIYERYYNLFLMIVGVMLYSFALTSISSMIQAHDEKYKKYYEKVKYLKYIGTKYNLGVILYNKLHRHLTHEKRSDNINKFMLLNHLPVSIRNKLMLIMYNDIIHSFKFFKTIQNEEFIIEALIYLKPTKSIKEDVLVKQGDYLEEIIFIKDGKLNLECFLKVSEFKAINEFNKIIKKDWFESKKILQLRRNEYYGDCLMIENEKSPFTLRTKSKTAELFLMGIKETMNLSSNFPSIFENIYIKSTRNMKMMKRMLIVKKKKIEKNIENENPQKISVVYENNKIDKKKENKKDSEIIGFQTNLRSKKSNYSKSNDLLTNRVNLDIERPKSNRNIKIKNSDIFLNSADASSVSKSKNNSIQLIGLNEFQDASIASVDNLIKVDSYQKNVLTNSSYIADKLSKEQINEQTNEKENDMEKDDLFCDDVCICENNDEKCIINSITRYKINANDLYTKSKKVKLICKKKNIFSQINVSMPYYNEFSSPKAKEKKKINKRYYSSKNNKTTDFYKECLGGKITNIESFGNINLLLSKNRELNKINKKFNTNMSPENYYKDKKNKCKLKNKFTTSDFQIQNENNFTIESNIEHILEEFSTKDIIDLRNLGVYIFREFISHKDDFFDYMLSNDKLKENSDRKDLDNINKINFVNSLNIECKDNFFDNKKILERKNIFVNSNKTDMIRCKKNDKIFKTNRHKRFYSIKKNDSSTSEKCYCPSCIGSSELIDKRRRLCKSYNKTYKKNNENNIGLKECNDILDKSELIESEKLRLAKENFTNTNNQLEDNVLIFKKGLENSRMTTNEEKFMLSQSYMNSNISEISKVLVSDTNKNIHEERKSITEFNKRHSKDDGKLISTTVTKLNTNSIIKGKKETFSEKMKKYNSLFPTMNKFNCLYDNLNFESLNSYNSKISCENSAKKNNYDKNIYSKRKKDNERRSFAEFTRNDPQAKIIKSLLEIRKKEGDQDIDLSYLSNSTQKKISKSKKENICSKKRFSYENNEIKTKKNKRDGCQKLNIDTKSVNNKCNFENKFDLCKIQEDSYSRIKRLFAVIKKL